MAVSVNLKKHFDAVDKGNTGLVDHHGFQSMLHGMTTCDSFLAKELIECITKSKEGKVTLDELQSKADSFAAPSPLTEDSQLFGGSLPVPRSLVGTWENELKSRMVISPYTYYSGMFLGSYNSKVGNAFLNYALVGMYDVDGDQAGGTLGWTVQWKNADNGNSLSNTAWSGQRYVSPTSGKFLIYTSWLLTSQKPFADNWKSTLIGKDQFTKLGPMIQTF